MEQVTKLFFMGQAGYVFKSKSAQTLGIDFYLSNYLASDDPVGFHRLMPEIFKPEEIIVDNLIATHFHRDHFDIDAMPKLMDNRVTKLICAYDCQRDVEQLKLDPSRVTYVRPGDHLVRGDFDITIIKCDHGQLAPLAVGVIIEFDGKRIVEVGDTCLHLDWKDEYLKRGPIDILIAPINGAWGNLNEQENVELAKALKPGLSIPCHFGMCPAHRGDPGLWMDLMKQQIPTQKYQFLTLGEGLEL
ncbi:MAG: MBL fold metallo-hydrolase [Bacteroidales bacterium]|nr:MBL fold metallo-hydrolase [Bacteroidales bacterium]